MIQKWPLSSSYPVAEDYLDLSVVNRVSLQLCSVHNKLLSVLQVPVRLMDKMRSRSHSEPMKRHIESRTQLTLMTMSWHLYFRAILSLSSGSSMRFTYSCRTCTLQLHYNVILISYWCHIAWWVGGVQVPI